MTHRTEWPERAFSGIVFAAFAGVSLVPVAAPLAQSFWRDGAFTVAAYSTVFQEPQQIRLLCTTLGIAAATALASVALGMIAAFAIARWRVPGRRALAWLLPVPFLIPPYLGAIAWADLLGRKGLFRMGLDAIPGNAPFSPYSIGGVVLVLTLGYFPLAAWIVTAALSRYDARVEDPARLEGGPAQVFRAVTLPLLAPAAASAALAVFMLALLEFGVPSFLQVNVYSVEIYTRFSASYLSDEAVAQAAPLLGCGLAALALWLGYLRPRFGPLDEIAGGPHGGMSKGAAAWAAALAVGGFEAAAVLLPAGILFARSLPLATYGPVWESTQEELRASLVLASVSATGLTALGLAMAWDSRSRRRHTRWYPLSLAAFLISGPVLGIGLIDVWNRSGPLGAVYDSPAILVLANMARYVFFPYALLQAALRDVPVEYDLAASLDGAGAWQRFRHVLLPSIVPTAASAWALGFVLSLRELDAAVLVAPPGCTTLAIRLFGLMHYGPSRDVAALSLIIIATALAGACAMACVLRCASTPGAARRSARRH